MCWSLERLTRCVVVDAGQIHCGLGFILVVCAMTDTAPQVRKRARRKTAASRGVRVQRVHRGDLITYSSYDLGKPHETRD